MIFIFPKQKQKPVVLEPTEWLLCIFLSGKKLHSGMQNTQSLT